MNLYLSDRIEKAFDCLIEANEQFRQAELAVELLRGEVLQEHFEELKIQRSNESKNQAIDYLLKDDEAYQAARATLVGSRMRLEREKMEVDRLKLLVQLEAAS